MKRYKCYSITSLFLFGAMLLMSGCSQDKSEKIEDQKGEAVTLKFDLSTATKADATTTDAMAAGNTIQVFAYKKSADVATTAPLASETYTVASNGSAMGNLKLFRGEYDLYFASYNASGQAPQLDASGGTITVENNKDFMCSSLSGISVQPVVGTTEQTVTMTDPFNRMGTQITTEVKANTTQPVPVNKMRVNYITVKNVSTPISWKLGTSAWNTSGQAFTEELSFTEFVGDENNYTAGYKSAPKVFLPTNGSSVLEFIINMNVNNKERNYKSTLQKPLLQGMGYNFIFSLTFYGDILLTDLTLAVKEYNRVSLSTDAIGKD